MITPADSPAPDLSKDEIRVDTALTGAAREDDWPCRIATSLLDHPARTASAYRAVGWRVQIVRDHRDGDYLEFLRP